MHNLKLKIEGRMATQPLRSASVKANCPILLFLFFFSGQAPTTLSAGLKSMWKGLAVLPDGSGLGARGSNSLPNVLHHGEIHLAEYLWTRRCCFSSERSSHTQLEAAQCALDANRTK